MAAPIGDLADTPGRRFHVVDGFLADPLPLRAAFERHFADPHRHGPATHGVWDYWHVPQLYTYLRALPERVLPVPPVDAFVARLRAWSTETVGCTTVGPPYLSLYVDGCGQGLHNDAENGAWGYVFSLTPSARRFDGGATLLLRPDDYWDSPRSRHAGAGTAFYDRIEPEFNRLIVFDDRLIHGVETVAGTMDPLAGRLVLHGHLRP